MRSRNITKNRVTVTYRHFHTFTSAHTSKGASRRIASHRVTSRPIASYRTKARSIASHGPIAIMGVHTSHRHLTAMSLSLSLTSRALLREDQLEAGDKGALRSKLTQTRRVTSLRSSARETTKNFFPKHATLCNKNGHASACHDEASMHRMGIAHEIA